MLWLTRKCNLRFYSIYIILNNTQVKLRSCTVLSSMLTENCSDLIVISMVRPGAMYLKNDFQGFTLEMVFLLLLLLLFFFRFFFLSFFLFACFVYVLFCCCCFSVLFALVLTYLKLLFLFLFCIFLGIVFRLDFLFCFV